MEDCLGPTPAATPNVPGELDPSLIPAANRFSPLGKPPKYYRPGCSATAYHVIIVFMEGFIAYAHLDGELVDALDTHLEAAGFKFWRDPRIVAGDIWDGTIRSALNKADVFILCVSASFLTRPYIKSVEMAEAFRRHSQGDALVIPVLLKSCRWQSHELLSRLHSTPGSGHPVSLWKDRDEALDRVVMDICAAIDKFRFQRKIREEDPVLSATERCRETFREADEWLHTSNIGGFAPPRLDSIIESVKTAMLAHQPIVQLRSSLTLLDHIIAISPGHASSSHEDLDVQKEAERIVLKMRYWLSNLVAAHERHPNEEALSRGESKLSLVVESKRVAVEVAEIRTEVAKVYQQVAAIRAEAPASQPHIQRAADQAVSELDIRKRILDEESTRRNTDVLAIAATADGVQIVSKRFSDRLESVATFMTASFRHGITALRRADDGLRTAYKRFVLSASGVNSGKQELGAAQPVVPYSGASVSGAPSISQGRLGLNPPELVQVPAGEFVMGIREDEGQHESIPENIPKWAQPQVSVRIHQAFSLGRFPVTVGEFRVFVNATSRDMGNSMYTFEGGDWKERAARSWETPGFGQRDDHPVVGVSWDDAQAYATWLSKQSARRYRLPTEAEWQYACRCGTITSRFWGESWSGGEKYAHASDQLLEGTAPVGSRLPNQWGLHDMLGNVWEWTQDEFSEGLVGQPTDGTAKGSSAGGRRAVVGGSWAGVTWFVRSGCRGWYDTHIRSTDLGFRIACTR